jgi:hypothetical protein
VFEFFKSNAEGTKKKAHSALPLNLIHSKIKELKQESQVHQKCLKEHYRSHKYFTRIFHSISIFDQKPSNNNFQHNFNLLKQYQG